MSTTNVASAILTMRLILLDDFILSSSSLCDMELTRFSMGKLYPQAYLARTQMMHDP
jgi:hypothetical protein